MSPERHYTYRWLAGNALLMGWLGFLLFAGQGQVRGTSTFTTMTARSAADSPGSASVQSALSLPAVPAGAAGVWIILCNASIQALPASTSSVQIYKNGQPLAESLRSISASKGSVTTGIETWLVAGDVVDMRWQSASSSTMAGRYCMAFRAGNNVTQ